jgi:hypothetical protein
VGVTEKEDDVDDDDDMTVRVGAEICDVLGRYDDKYADMDYDTVMAETETDEGAVREMRSRGGKK